MTNFLTKYVWEDVDELEYYYDALDITYHYSDLWWINSTLWFHMHLFIFLNQFWSDCVLVWVLWEWDLSAISIGWTCMISLSTLCHTCYPGMERSGGCHKYLPAVEHAPRLPAMASSQHRALSAWCIEDEAVVVATLRWRTRQLFAPYYSIP